MTFKPVSRIAISVITTVVCISLASACSTNNVSGGGGDTKYVSNTGGISTARKADRRSAGKISGQTLEGKKLDVSSLRGQVVVLNVWGSWCPPCRAEAPYFAKVAKEKKADGVSFVGINARDSNKRAAIAFEETYKIEYPSLYDPAGKLMLSGFPKGTLTPQGIPSTVVLDRDGKIAARALRAIDDEDLRSMIDPLISEK